MKPRFFVLAAFFLVAIATISGQSPVPATVATLPSFAVASVKPSVPSADGRIFVDWGPRPGGQWIAQNTELISILRSAYPAFSLPGQIVGGPDWVGTARFDINARAEREAPPEVMADMLKRLLADRFGLRVHTEPREIDVYVLTLARTDGRLGPGLRTTDSADRGPARSRPYRIDREMGRRAAVRLRPQAPAVGAEA